MQKSELKPGPLLAKVNAPEDLRKLEPEQLNELAKEVRNYILDVISVHPGHLGASLGVVELTIALHYVFNTPYDRLIWDVGHQAYPHKILTGRRDIFHTLRHYQGISGFPSRKESEYDAFGTGHASTSISAALGMATASQLKGEKDRNHIAVIGDGAMTGGMAIEGLNNAGASHANLLIILNDNGIAIDKSTGVFKDYLTGMLKGQPLTEQNLKAKIERINQRRKAVKNKENNLKDVFLRSSNLFEAFHFSYFGPVDGNDIQQLVAVLKEIKKLDGPKLLHIVTTKGKGFEQAEKEQTIFHAPGPFDRETGALLTKNPEDRISYQEVYGKTLLELAQKDEKVIAVTPAMPSGSALNFMADEFPDRVFDVGIAEQHAVTFSAGLASEGFIPFCTIYSTFLQRAYDQVIHDVALQNLPVIFGIDRAGLVGGDGATHHGIFDLAYLNSIPNMVVAAPMDELELRNMMFTASSYRKGPFAIRYPRGYGFVGVDSWHQEFEEIPVGKGRMLRDGKDIAIITLGQPGNFALEACRQLEAEGIQAALCDLRFLKPLDENLLKEIFQKFKYIITIEDGVIRNGMGSAVAALAALNRADIKLVNLGIPDYFVEQGSKDSLYHECGMDIEGIIHAVKHFDQGES